MNAEPLRELLKKRKMNFAKLARQVGVSRNHLYAVLAGRMRGRHVWRRVEECLDFTEREKVVEIYGNVFGER